MSNVVTNRKSMSPQATWQGWQSLFFLTLMLLFVVAGMWGLSEENKANETPMVDSPFVGQPARLPLNAIQEETDGMLSIQLSRMPQKLTPPEGLLEEVTIGLDNGQRVFRIRAVSSGDELILDMTGKLIAIRPADGRATLLSQVEQNDGINGGS